MKKNLYTAILASLDAGDIDKTKKVISDSLNIVNSATVLDTGHPAIDAVVQSKLDICKNEDIDTDFKFKYREDIVIDNIELSIIIGNLLDNSIEACQKLPFEKRWISFLICVENSEINISVDNSSSTLDEKEKFKTTKKDKSNHGFGLKNIKNIASKYNGDATFGYENNKFSSYVYLENIEFK